MKKRSIASIYIQCPEKKTGKIGSFLGDDAGIAISPIFPDLAALFLWTKRNGWIRMPNTYITMEKIEPGHTLAGAGL